MFALILFIFLAPTSTTYNLNDAIKAIKLVEVGNSDGIGVIGDNGAAFGPLQIHEAYWIDSGVKGSHRQCLESYEYSRRVFVGYMARYAPRQLARLKNGTASLTDLEIVARIHNGGPSGHTRDATLAYWKKVKARL